MVMQANIAGARPVSQPAQQQAGTPHISVDSAYIKGLQAQIHNLYSTPEHHRFQEIPATPGRLDPAAAAEQSAAPEVQVTTLQLHPNVEASEPAADGPIQVAEGVSSLDLVAALSQFDPELAELASAAVNEQSVLAGAI